MNTEDASFVEERRLMVREQLQPAQRGIVDPRVLAAMERVPRHHFVPRCLWSKAYADRPLPIGGDQTISQPFIVALMTQILELRPDDRVLEIGTGCGYQTAVLSELAADVFSVEWHEELADQARESLAKLGYEAHVKVGDGWQGWAEYAPYDRIIVTCAPQEVPSALVDQLADSGVMVVPIGPAHKVQLLLRVRKIKGLLEMEALHSVRFVPMLGGR